MYQKIHDSFQNQVELKVACYATDKQKLFMTVISLIRNDNPHTEIKLTEISECLTLLVIFNVGEKAFFYVTWLLEYKLV